MLWTRALPGTVAVLAALSLPELSLGAGAPDDAQTASAQAREPALAAARAVGSSPKLELSAAQPAPAGLRAPLGPVIELAASKSSRAFAVAAMVLPEPQASAVAGRLAEMAPPARVAAAPSQGEALALAVPAVVPAIVAVAPAATDLANAPKAAGPDGAPAAGAKGSFGGPDPSGMNAPNAALAVEGAVLAVPSVPVGARDAAPDRRSALAPEPAPAPAPIAQPAGLSERVAVAAPPARTVAPLLAPLAAAVPVAAPAPAPVRAGTPAPAATRRVAANAVPSAPVRAAAPALATPRQKPATPPAATAARARVAVPSAPASAAALVPLPQAKPKQAAPLARPSGAFQIDVKSQLTTRVDGKLAGKVDFQQTSSGLQVRLGSIVELLGDRYNPAQIARIRASSASELYLPLAQLQAQGIPISYDPVYDEFNVGLVDTRPKAARKVHMDQISAPERGPGSTGIDQVRR